MRDTFLKFAADSALTYLRLYEVGQGKKYGDRWSLVMAQKWIAEYWQIKRAAV
jgi:hypothetical protein